MEVPPRRSSVAGGGLVQDAAERIEKVVVVVRVRPLLPHEASAGERRVWTVPDSRTLTYTPLEHLEQTPIAQSWAAPLASRQGLLQSGSTGLGTTPNSARGPGVPQLPQSFAYDRVYSEANNSQELYVDTVQPLVLSAMAGYNSCIFAWGQTGAGKTYTMSSVMRRAAHDIFDHIKSNPSREFLLRMSAIEIYNEVVKDLLRDDGTALKVQDDGERGVCVDGLTEEGISSPQQLEDMLRAVETRRHVRDTRMNQSSSRSHQIVKIYIESRPMASAETGLQPDEEQEVDEMVAFAPITMSCINFVDLAGSERLNQAATDDADKEKLRQKEASNINRSLLTLGTIIRALGDATGRKHVPYRDSKLTRILQPSLSGNARMAIVCTVSPASGSAENTRNALHFANSAKRITMRPKVNEVADEKAIIKRMQAEIDTLRRQMAVQERAAAAATVEQQLAAALNQQEELVRRAAEEKERLQRRLQNLERLILRADMGVGGGMPKARRSCDDMDLAASCAPPDSGVPGSMAVHGSGASATAATSGNSMSAANAAVGSGAMKSARGRHPAAAPMRASWNPGMLTSAGSPAKSEASMGVLASARRHMASHGGGSMARASGIGGYHDVMLLDYFLAPSVRKAASKAAEPISTPPASSKPHVPKLDMSRVQLQQLQAQAPTGQQAEEALAALKAEVRCIAHANAVSSSTVLPRTAPLLGAAAAAAPASAAAAAAGAADNVEAAIESLAAELGALEEEVAALERGKGDGDAAELDRRRELLEAVRAELSRLRSLQEVRLRATRAIESLQQKIHTASHVEADAGELPGWLQDVVSVSTANELAAGATFSEAAGEYEVESRYTGQQPLHSHRYQGRAESMSDTASSAQQPTPRSVSEQQRPQGRHEIDVRADGEDEVEQGVEPVTPVASLVVGGRLRAQQQQQQQELDEGEVSSVAVKKDGVRASRAADEDTGHKNLDQFTRQPGTPRSHARHLSPAPATPQQGASSGPAGEWCAPAASEGAATSLSGLSPGVPADSADAGTAVSSRRGADVSITSGNGGPAGSGSAVRSGQRWDAGRVKEVLRSQKDAVTHWYKAELRRMQEAFKSSAERDVASVREALDQYREQAERLEMQKKLLLNQVLKLELSLEEEERAKAELQATLAKAYADRDQARFEAVQAKAAARAAAAAAASAQAAAAVAQQSLDQPQMMMQPPSPEQMSMFDATDDGWGEKDTPDTLMPRIMEMWEELYVPLAYRSRFFLTFKGKELFYYDMEYRRLEWKRSQAAVGTAAAAAAAGFGQVFGRNKELDRAARALDWERKSLAQSLKYNLNDEQREVLFQAWDINPATKERKLQLVHKVWHPRTLAQLDGAQRSAELVVSLTSGTDPSEQFMELFFGSSGAGMRPSPINVVVNGLVRRVATPRGKRSPLAAGSSSGNNGAAAPANSSGNSRPSTPRRNSFGSFGSKLLNMSFLSKQRGLAGAAGGGGAGGESILSAAATHLQQQGPFATPRQGR